MLKEKLPVIFLLLFVAGNTGICQNINTADELFKKGNFIEAEKEYKRITEKDATSLLALRQYARIALINNNLEDAETRIKRVLLDHPADSVGNTIMAEILRRQDKYTETIPYYKASDREAKAAQMTAFRSDVPFLIESKKDKTVIKFESTDPLPVIKVRVNNGEAVLFLLDTGGGDVIIDNTLSKSLGVPIIASEKKLFAGGQQSMVDLGKIESLKIGDMLVKNIPVNIQDLSRLSMAAGGQKVSGIITTNFLYHFISSIDYISGQLVLEKKTAEKLAAIKAKRSKSTIPFWIASTHIMVANGNINGIDDALLFIDTGLAAPGISFTCPEGTMKTANIQPMQGQAIIGQGGGGQVQVTPFTLKELSMGHIKKTNVIGITGAFPEYLEYRVGGFRIGGLVSHGFFRESILTFDFENMALHIN